VVRTPRREGHLARVSGGGAKRAERVAVYRVPVDAGRALPDGERALGLFTVISTLVTAAGGA